MLKVGFFSNQLSLRGTEVVIYTYADLNETMLGNKSIIISYKLKEETKDKTRELYARFENRFTTYLLDEDKDTIEKHLDAIVEQEKLDVLHISKWGIFTPVMTKKCPTIVHAIFKMCQPHGTLYLGVSEYVARKCGFSEEETLPNIVQLHDTQETLREELGIPPGAFVFGRQGGYESFDIPFVKECVVSIAIEHPGYHFVFLNTEPFSDLPNIHYLEATPDPERKRMFLNTCNCMLHARSMGETCGLSCAEFSILNKPVITCPVDDVAHIEYLTKNGNSCLVYTYADELTHIMRFIGTEEGSQMIQGMQWKGFECLEPQNVMPIFAKKLSKAIEVFASEP